MRHETKLYQTNSGHFVDQTRKFGLENWEIGMPIRVHHTQRIKCVPWRVAPAPSRFKFEGKPEVTDGLDET